LWIVPGVIGASVLAVLFAYQQSSPIDIAHARRPQSAALAFVADVPLPRRRPARPHVGAPLDLRPPSLR
jgi:hypothetical protein